MLLTVSDKRKVVTDDACFEFGVLADKEKGAGPKADSLHHSA
jgi:hypothetical protein